MTQKSEKKAKGKNSCIKEVPYIVTGFSRNMKAILQFMQILNPMIDDIKKQAPIVDKLFDQKGKEVAGRQILAKSKLTSKEIQIIEEHFAALRKISPSLSLLKKSSFLILISYLEFLMKDILKVYYYQHWEALQDKEVKVSITDLNVSSDIEELKKLVVEGYVDGLIYKNWQEQVKLVLKILGIKDQDLSSDLDLINEADKRRNILIHNEGKVNQKYIRESGKNIPIGTELKITDSYFDEVYNEIYVFGLILLTYLSVNMKNVKALHWILGEDVFELLKKEKYSLVLKYFNSCKKIDFIDGELETESQVNYLLALKYSGMQKEYEKELNKIKTSHLQPIFQLAFAVLKNDKRKFYQLISKAKLRLDDWENWPLFKEFKEDEELSKKVYQKLKKKNAKE